jgi:ribonuclease BN (tRNA processing enzyme)
MKLTVLGATGGFPARGTATSGYLLELDGHYILIDCGSVCWRVCRNTSASISWRRSS